MKKLFFTLLLMGGLLTVSAQQEWQLMHASVRVGPNLATLLVPKSTISSQSAFGYYSEQKVKIGAQVGLLFDFRLKERLTLQTGVYYALNRFGQTQTAVYTDSNQRHWSVASENLYTMHRVQIPVMVRYQITEGPKHFVVGAGLFADIALSGNLVYDASAVVNYVDPSNNVEVTNNYLANGNFDPFKNDMKYLYYHKTNDDYINKYNLGLGSILNRFDVGLAAEIGYQINKFYVGLHLNVGLLNMAQKAFIGDEFRQSSLAYQLHLGYTIN